MAKGNDFEWVIARKLSLWLTGGKDKTQLVRSIQSGGNANLKVSASRPEYQVGDLAPNGPQGEEFRRRFGVECKNYHLDPDWWHLFSYETWVVEGWWKKISSECDPYHLTPLLIMRRDRFPVVVAVPQTMGLAFHLGGFDDLDYLFISRMSIRIYALEDILKLDPSAVMKVWNPIPVEIDDQVQR